MVCPPVGLTSSKLRVCVVPLRFRRAAESSSMSRCCEIELGTGLHPVEDLPVRPGDERVARDMILLLSVVAFIVLVVTTAAAL